MTNSRQHRSHPEIAKRLKRADGHLHSILTMLEEKRGCLEIAQQLDLCGGVQTSPVLFGAGLKFWFLSWRNQMNTIIAGRYDEQARAIQAAIKLAHNQDARSLLGWKLLKRRTMRPLNDEFSRTRRQ